MHYSICVRGHLDPIFQDRFVGLHIEQQATGTALLVGTLPDQFALYGVLLQLIRLGLVLLSLETKEEIMTVEENKKNDEAEIKRVIEGYISEKKP